MIPRFGFWRVTLGLVGMVLALAAGGALAADKYGAKAQPAPAKGDPAKGDPAKGDPAKPAPAKPADEGAKPAPAKPPADGAKPPGGKAEPDDTPDPADLTPQELAALLRENIDRTAAAFKDKKYAEAEKLTRAGARLAPKHPTFPYNLACALAQQGKKAEALDALEAAVKLGFNDPAKIKEDEDLAAIRAEPRFGRIVETARAQRLAGLGKYEAGAEIKGVKTVEGDPEAGLRWRLRIGPDAAKAKPHRLVVWLHPSGGSMNAQVEKLAPELAARGFALLVLTQKSFAGWTGEDADRLIKGTLPDVAAKAEAVAVEKPILLGFSAGGQVALAMYEKEPGRFGGLVLDAAYPIRPMGGARFAPLPPPKDPAAKKVPVYAIVGEMDGGAQLWRVAQPAWRGAGVPLTVRYVPEARHQWLFGKAQLEDLYKWLGEVKEGKLPADAATRPSTKPLRNPRDFF